MGVLKSSFHNKAESKGTALKNRAVPTLIAAVVFCGALVVCGLLGPLDTAQIHTTQGHTSATGMEIGTVPSGYFQLTVSPAEVHANVGEQVEIRCSIYCLIDTVVEINSVDVLLFDSYGSMVREQAMTKDSYWSAHTVYTIVGDEAYYRIKFNFGVRGDPSGEHSEYGAHSFPILSNVRLPEVIKIARMWLMPRILVFPFHR